MDKKGSTWKSLGVTDADRDHLFAEANKIREDMIMKAAADLQDELFKYSDQKIVDSKTRNVRIKVTIV